MNNPLDTRMSPMPALLSLTANTNALFQGWMTHALARLAISPETLVQGQIALVTLTAQERDNSALPASIHTPANRMGHFPNTTCTLSWKQGYWTVCSLSNLTQIEESHPPCTEHAFWLGQHVAGYRMQWGAMCHEDTVTALQGWERALHTVQALQVLVTLQIGRQEHEVMIPTGCASMKLR